MKNLFNKNESTPIYILLDNADQNYNRKTYPLISKYDLNKIIKRDLVKEQIDQNDKSFRGHHSVKNRPQHKWDCTFISSSTSPETELWIEFLLTLPNYLVGIYTLPLEIEKFSQTVLDTIKAEQNLKINNETIISLTIQSKISGVRQIAFYNKSIVFTRVINYDFKNPKFSEHFIEDMLRAHEYLKMTFSQLKSQNLITINILSEEITNKILNIPKKDLKFINYSPYQISQKLGIKNSITKNSNFSDTIVSNYIANNKKTLKFSTPKIYSLTKINFTLKSIFVINFLIFIVILNSVLNIFHQQNQFNKKTETLFYEKEILNKKLQIINRTALEGNQDTDNKHLADTIIDFGKITKNLSEVDVNILKIFNDLSLIKKHNIMISSFNYNILKYNPEEKQTSSNLINLTIDGTIFDKSGDIETIFKKYDAAGLETKKKFPQYNTTFSRVEENINFSQKYYSLPIHIKFEKQ